MVYRNPPVDTGKNFPGYINVVTIEAAPYTIQSAFVRRNEGEKHAVIELGFYAGRSRTQIAEARRAALVAVLKHLGPEWSADTQAREPKDSAKSLQKGRKSWRRSGG